MVDGVSRLVVLGADGNLCVVGGDGAGLVRLTDDGGADARHLQPTWMADGRHVIWSRVRSPTEGWLEVARADGSSRRAMPPGFPAFYLYPSPDGRRVAHLSEGPLGLELMVLDLGSGESTLMARGAPLYWSWAPDGRWLFMHVGDELSLASLEGDVDILAVEPGAFLAPWWSADALVYVARAGERHRLVVADRSGEVLSVAAEFEGVVRFIPDPAGRRVAYVVHGLGGPGSLMVVDLATGRRTEVTEEPVLGFWWSPDSIHLLVLRLLGSAMPWLRCSVWDEDGLRSFGPFLPSAALVREVLPFFEQFAQSHGLWSPDSSAFTYPGLLESGRRGIWVQALDGSEPCWVADGLSAWWSPV
jgi:TolB protein